MESAGKTERNEDGFSTDGQKSKMRKAHPREKLWRKQLNKNVVLWIKLFMLLWLSYIPRVVRNGPLDEEALQHRDYGRPRLETIGEDRAIDGDPAPD